MQASTVGIARQGKVVDVAWLPTPGNQASVLVVAGDDGQLSFLDAAHSAAQQAERARGQAFRHLPGSGRPFPLVCSILANIVSASVPAHWGSQLSLIDHAYCLHFANL